MRNYCTIAIMLIIFQNLSFGQGEFSINGHIRFDTTSFGISDCIIELCSSDGTRIETKSDSLGFYSINKIPRVNSKFEIRAEKHMFYPSKKKVYFTNFPHDTVVDFSLVFMVVEFYWIRNIHFNKNSFAPEKHFSDSLATLVEMLNDNPKMKIKIVGHKDKLEVTDCRWSRAKLIYDRLLELGIAKDRLLIEISDSPAEYFMVERDWNSGMRKMLKISENYINSFSKKQQKKVRRLNQCVTFEIINN